MLRYEFQAMGCRMLAVVDSDADRAREAVVQASGWFAEWEAALSRFRDDSELSALNRAAGEPMQVSETLYQVIRAALAAAEESVGLVTPALLDAVIAAGYDRSFEFIEHAPVRQSMPQREATPDWRAIVLDDSTRSVRLPVGMRLDLGGIAKGWAADQAALRLAVVAPALVDAGGDIRVGAPRSNGERWPIAVADPFQKDSDLELLSIEQGGVATSGRDYRRWQRNGQWQHHIIDPRTGNSADTDVLTATVIAPTTAEAEVGAKAALILGSRVGLEWIEARSEMAGLLVLDDGRTVRSRRLAAYV